jgi:threonine dehydratase
MRDGSGLVTIDDIRDASNRLRNSVVRTPLLAAPWAGPLWLKPENLQPVGSFKLRGALNSVAMLEPDVRARGLVTDSSGNHAQALAWAARAYNVPATIVMPDAAVPVKVEATRALGANVVIVPAAQRTVRAEAIKLEHELTLIPPFDYFGVIAGAGTVGLEIVEDLSELDTVLVPVGGGGLISGVAVVVKTLQPNVRVVAVEPELAADLAESMARGERVAWEASATYRTVADGVRLPMVGELNWQHIHRYVDEVVTVSEDAILDAMALIATRSRIVAEPTGALATAAYLASPERFGRTVAVVSGGNADPALLATALGAMVSAAATT